MRFHLPHALGIAGLCAAAVVASVVAPQQALAAPVSTSVKQQVLSDARTSILAMATKSGSKDSQFLTQGRFRFAGVECYRCEVGPAVGAAALYKRTGDTKMRQMALNVFDRAIKDQMRPDGSFSKGVKSEGSNGIQTLFFAEHLGAAMYYLDGTLDSARRGKYTKALTGATDFLIAQGLLSYYVNGNINLAITVVMGMSAKYTGARKYRAAYEKSLAFTLRPGGRFAKFGLKITKKGSKSLGRDTRGYLAESGSFGVGFDPDYTAFQADIAGQGYQVLADKRLLTLVNQINNQLLTRVNTKTWAFDVSGGTRHDPKGFDLYQSPALQLAAANGRPELKTMAQSQVVAATRVMRESSTQAWPGIYQAWGTRFAVTISTIV